MKITILALLLLLQAVVPARAALGEFEGSVNLDQQVLRGQMRDEVHTGYKIHAITSAEGAVVREYASPAGRIFAITWRARMIPNLQQLLGSYFPRIQQAAQAKVGRAGPLVIRNADFVYFSGGRMMNFQGRAYVPALMPQNVSTGVMQ